MIVHWIKSAVKYDPGFSTGNRHTLWQVGDYQYQIDDELATVKHLNMSCEEAIMEFDRIVGVQSGETV